jgi:hypothetical protein
VAVVKADLEVIPDWVDERELEQEFFATLAMKLARYNGAALTSRECNALLKLVRNRPALKRERGRPPADWQRQYDIAMRCVDHMWSGMSVRAAVAATAKELDVSQGTVWKARKLFCSS